MRYIYGNLRGDSKDGVRNTPKSAMETSTSGQNQIRQSVFPSQPKATRATLPSLGNHGQSSGLFRPFSVLKSRISNRKSLMSILPLILIIGVTVFAVSKKDGRDAAVTSETLTTKKIEKPQFTAIVPSDSKSQTNIKYDHQKKVFNYSDQIDGIAITVSQQQMPEGFKPNTAESVRKLAEQFSANEKITAGEITAYIGTSEKGPQSVVTYKEDLLIFLTSPTKISNSSWGNYISNLK